MTDEMTSSASNAADSRESAPKTTEKEEESFWVFLIKLVVIVAIFRSFIFSPFNIPSESMLPRLMDGDYLLASKWSYGYSKYSMPFSAPLIPGRIFASQPERGDVVIFKAPPGNDIDYIKRVIGLPGDTVQVIDGVVHLNGKAIPKERIADAVIPVSPNTECADAVFAVRDEDGTESCHYPRFRETLPGGRKYEVLDFGLTPQDNTQPVIVPEGRLFLMGDNRDNSEDSRFPAREGRGVGLVPQDNLVGKASIVMWSTDGSANYFLPWTWFTAARFDRIGGTF
ncbi:MAG: signal peptidase I [Novosphingobium sp.]|nr:signal peptidase I [Novosphingobium sp.]